MYTDPTLDDQTSWFTLDKLKLFRDEIETVRELLDIEPDSACKWMPAPLLCQCVIK